ncbi:MAG: cytochrome c peroxidase [Sphingobium sp.]
MASAGTLTAEQSLGKALFFDTSLSNKGTQACGSCHMPTSAFTDPGFQFPTSAGDNPDLFGNRNTPSAMYAAYSPIFSYDNEEGLYVGGQFWDGRAATLEDQAKAPFLNPVEMGNASPADVVGKLQSGANASAFAALYGETIFDDVDAAYGKIAQAIAEYERSPELSPFSSKYDYYLQGQVKLSITEERGLALFNDPEKGNCAACHISEVGPGGELPLFTDFTYDNIGIPKNYDSGFLTMPEEFNPDGVSFLDLGLGGIVGDESLYGAFKVPTLRNIGITAPYGHNGYFDSLDQVVDFYATRDVKAECVGTGTSAADATALHCWPAAEFPDQMNVDELGNLPLNSWEKSYLVSFLNTLTDGYQISAVPEPATWSMLIVGFAGIGATMRRKGPGGSRRNHATA